MSTDVKVPRLKERYETTILPELKEKFGLENVMDVPRLQKIVVNMGVGDANTEARLMEAAVNELSVITGQKPSIRRARRSVSNFKLREGQNIGCMVTLRGKRMYEFMDRLFNIAMPRVRDFRGLALTSFDGFGNYTMGLREQTIFPELNIDSVQRVRGMNITFVIDHSQSNEQSIALLRSFGMPLVKD
ncbi:MAG: 50S ribosomal protein L5 [Candidatus Hydrogenedentes bacterium]|nr:50S ribosomal protein L5 [Candidatus Hydrogenedentota bacterium]